MIIKCRTSERKRKGGGGGGGACPKEQLLLSVAARERGRGGRVALVSRKND